MFPTSESGFNTSRTDVDITKNMLKKKLKAITEEECDLLESKEPRGTYDRETREKLYWIIEKLRQNKRERTWFESGLYRKFRNADFGLLVRGDTEGEINFDGTVRIEGKFKGPVNVRDSLFIAGYGKVIGDIHADTVVCKGRITGDVRALKRVEIQPDGIIEGNVHAPSFQIEPGGRFEGRCHMTAHKKKSGNTRPSLFRPLWGDAR